MSKKKKDQAPVGVLRARLLSDLETVEIDGQPMVQFDVVFQDESKFSITMNCLEYSTEERESGGESRVVYRLEEPSQKHSTTTEFPPLPKRFPREIFFDFAEERRGFDIAIPRGRQSFVYSTTLPALPAEVGGDDLTDEYLSHLLRLIDELNQSLSGVMDFLNQRGRAEEKMPGPGSAEAVEGETVSAIAKALATLRTANLLDDPTDFLVGHAFGYLLHSSLVARNEARRKYAKALKARRGSGKQVDERQRWIKRELLDLIKKKSTAGKSRRQIKSLIHHDIIERDLAWSAAIETDRKRFHSIVLFEKGFGLVRASRNMPELSLIFEGETEDDMLHIRDIFKAKLDTHPEIDRRWENDVR